MSDMVKTSSWNVVWCQGRVSEDDRRGSLTQNPLTIWLTGLSGSGKSTVAYDLKYELLDRGFKAFVLDGDNVRHGLCGDLGFSADDRAENIRRVAEVARLMNDAGLIVISVFISPYRRDRDGARRIIGEERYVKVYLSTPIEICEQRGPGGTLRKGQARADSQLYRSICPLQDADRSVDPARYRRAEPARMHGSAARRAAAACL